MNAFEFLSSKPSKFPLTKKKLFFYLLWLQVQQHLKARSMKKCFDEKIFLRVFSRFSSRWCIIRCLFIVTERLVSAACQSYTTWSLTVIYLFASCFFSCKTSESLSEESTAHVWHWKFSRVDKISLSCFFMCLQNFPTFFFNHAFLRSC